MLLSIKLSLDDDRIKEIGPNMACAEWLMKNGAQVRWKGCNEFVSHYDCLPHSQCGFLYKFKIEQVYAGKEASISHIGFRYFSTCTYTNPRSPALDLSKSFGAATNTVFHVVSGRFPSDVRHSEISINHFLGLPYFVFFWSILYSRPNGRGFICNCRLFT